jgi:hypothetical protein
VSTIKTRLAGGATLTEVRPTSTTVRDTAHATPTAESARRSRQWSPVLDYAPPH